MPSKKIANIDRRVKIIDGEENMSTYRSVSDLRTLPYVVLLGEPGIGKTTVFETEATNENAAIMKVRDLMTSKVLPQGGTLFLDGLDEYRVDGEKANKVHDLAQAILACNVDRWRLSCRSEDWRKAADSDPIQRRAANQKIVVAQLLPLNSEEAEAVLKVLGDPDPKVFLKKAEDLGAAGFIESPLSLKLLHKAVSHSGAWPSKRIDLFSSAVERLSFETNDEYKQIERASPVQIIDIASRACLILLLSGSRALWRSNGQPPAEDGDSRAYLSDYLLELNRQHLSDALDTALFRGEGESFEPMHRTIAEYLAGRDLAQVVIGKYGRAAFPLSRALALITGPDGLPPTELRGLFGWFATHLSHLGDALGAARLIRQDAGAVLAYGDAAIFNKANRIEILNNLDRNDPYFRMSDVGDTAIGGLAGEDLVEEFAKILNDQSDGTHRMLTVFEALKSGPPVFSLSPLMLSISLDPARSEWQRRNAMDVTLHIASDSKAMCRFLFDSLVDEKISSNRAALRAYLAAQMSTDELSVSDIKTVLSDYQSADDNGTSMVLYQLQKNLEKNPPLTLFDERKSNWLEEKRHGHHSFEVEHFIDHVLAEAIRSTRYLDPIRLWRWASNVRDWTWENLGKKTAAALSSWIDQVAGRDVALFRAALSEDEVSKGSWTVVNSYVATTRRHPSNAIIIDLIESAIHANSSKLAKRILQIAVHAALCNGVDSYAYWRLYDYLCRQQNTKRLLEKLTVSRIEKWRLFNYKDKKKHVQRRWKDVAANVKALLPVVEKMAMGEEVMQLDWAAQIYFERKDNRSSAAGLERIKRRTNDEITSAILQGWGVLLKGKFEVDSRMLGKADAESRRFFIEFPILAELDRMIDGQIELVVEELPLLVPIIILKSGSIIEHGERRTALEKIAKQRLDIEPKLSELELYNYWDAMLDAGATRLDGMWRFADPELQIQSIPDVLQNLLSNRPSMPEQALKMILRAASKNVDRSKLQNLMEKAVANPLVQGYQKIIWCFLGMALDPTQYEKKLQAELAQYSAEKLIEKLAGIFESFSPYEGNRLQYEAAVIRVIAPFVEPGLPRKSGWVTPMMQVNDRLNSALNWIGNQSSIESLRTVGELIDDKSLDAHRNHLRHARAQILFRYRDSIFQHPLAKIIEQAIAGGAPANAADLRAVVVEELVRLRAEMHIVDNTPWKRYWNTDANGNVTEPRVENQCRDALKERLQDRLKAYQINALIPEARRAEETRVDMLVMNAAGRNLPIEIKRHYHKEMWVAASTQLQGYASDPGADGNGIYLVFWFGEIKPTPPRSDGKRSPESANELEGMIISDLSSELRERTDVIVMDVSQPI